MFKVSLEGFDCVTYMETVLALAQSRSTDEFIVEMREMRYANARIVFRPDRNHYMIDWAGKRRARRSQEHYP